MKKVLSIFLVFFLAINTFSQTPCLTTNNLNISTGQNGNGGQVTSGTADPFWASTSTGANNLAVNNPWSSYPNYNKVAGAMVLNYSTSATGTFTFKRCFYLCENETIKFDGVWRCDNTLVSLKLVNCDNPNQVFWTYSQPSSSVANPQCWKDVGFSGSAALNSGRYALEFTYKNNESYNGFAIQAKLTSNKNVLSNSANCCCNCGTWGGIKYAIKGSTKPIAANLKCSQTLVVKQGQSVNLSPIYMPSSPNCQPTFKGTLYMPNGTTQNITSFPYNFSNTQAGYYVITIVPAIAGKNCPPCKIRIFVTPGCDGDILTEKEFTDTVQAGEGKG